VKAKIFEQADVPADALSAQRTETGRDLRPAVRVGRKRKSCPRLVARSRSCKRIAISMSWTSVAFDNPPMARTTSRRKTPNAPEMIIRPVYARPGYSRSEERANVLADL
jgi:hypothetical protein